MNEYIPFPGEQSLLPPGHFDNTRFFYFLLRADQSRLESLCERYLNGPSGGQCHYEPLGVVLLGFSHMDRLTSHDPKRGSFEYKDIAFWVPVLGGRSRPLCVFPPLIFVDDAATLVTGREIYGLPKQLGRFQMPLHPSKLDAVKPPEFRAEIVGTLQDGGPNSWRTLLTLEFVGEPDSCNESQFLDALGNILAPSLRAGLDIPRWLAEPLSVPCVGLKQFRDVAHPNHACYQAVVEAPLRIQNLRKPPQLFHNAFQLTLMDVPSHPVSEVLGIAEGTSLVPLALFFQANMYMGAGEVVGGGHER